MTRAKLYEDAVRLLQQLVRTPSPSREEGGTADILGKWLSSRGLQEVHRSDNNVWVRNAAFDPAKPTILLCSHHDTVRPTVGYTRDPYDGAIESIGGKVVSGEMTPPRNARLWGLGSNDAGASVVAMAAAFRHFYERNDLKFNLILALVAEEEVSGAGGVRSILSEMGLGSGASHENTVNFAIIGEPTGMRLAIAEKGLMVLDCVAHGRAGHAARDEGDNAIYHALSDIEWLRTFRFPRHSPLFGDVKMSVTMISAGSAHNVVPAECRFTVDVRVTEQYTNEEVLAIVRSHVEAEVTPRSLHLRSSSISPGHPVVQAGTSLGISTFGSPTTSDQVAMTIPSVKIGPGESSRSHSADEYVELAEIERGIELYINILERIL